MKHKIILLHGALGSKTQFSALRTLLSSRFEVFDLNFSGHGGRPAKDSFTIDQFVQDTIDFMDDQQIKSAYFFGYSMGGYVALRLAHDFPDRAESIITLGTKYLWNPETAAKDVRMMNPDIIEQKIPAFANTLKERHQPGNWKNIMHSTAVMMTELGDGKAMTTEHFKAIDHKVLVCIGTDDHMVSIDESNTTAEVLTHGQLKIIEGFRHPIESVDIETLGAICMDFFTPSGSS